VTSSSVPPPVLLPDPDSIFVQPARLLLPSTQSTTIRTTPRVPDPPILNVPAAQTPDVSVVKLDDDHSHDHDHHGIDICKDPFHSFLCVPVVPSKRKRPTGELPARFRNPVPQNLLGAGSSNQPAKLFPSDTKRLTSTPPASTTISSVQPNEPTRIAFQYDILPQPAKGAQVKLLPQAELEPKDEDPSKRLFNSIPCHKNRSTIESPEANASRLPPSNLRGDSSFVSPSKVLPSLTLNAQGTESKRSELGYVYPVPFAGQQTATPSSQSTQHTGYVYDPPSKPLQYPDSPLRGDSTFVQPLNTSAPNTLSGQGTENRELSSDSNEFSGYNYQKPSRPFKYPTSLSITPSVTPYSTSLQGARHQEDVADILTSPFKDIPSTASSNTHYRNKLTSFPTNGQNAKDAIPQIRPYDPYSNLAQRDDQPRPFAIIGAATDQKPDCDHSSPESTDVDSARSAPLSPSQFVRGPTAAASVLAASNELQDKCNHPFLGYVCKRSSDDQARKNK
jgi:hypothetical protein